MEPKGKGATFLVRGLFVSNRDGCIVSEKCFAHSGKPDSGEEVGEEDVDAWSVFGFDLGDGLPDGDELTPMPARVEAQTGKSSRRIYPASSIRSRISGSTGVPRRLCSLIWPTRSLMSSPSAPASTCLRQT